MPCRKKKNTIATENEIKKDEKGKGKVLRSVFIFSSSQLHASPKVRKHADCIGSYCSTSIVVVFNVE